MNSSKKSLVIPFLMISVGVGRLLMVQGVAPEINWIATLGMAAVGILAFVLFGLDKVSVVIGPFFLVGSLCSALRQSGMLSIESEVPILVILIGLLLIVARSPSVPSPNWLLPLEPLDGKKSD